MGVQAATAVRRKRSAAGRADGESERPRSTDETGEPEPTGARGGKGDAGTGNCWRERWRELRISEEAKDRKATVEL
jgi:hypothetical protein